MTGSSKNNREIIPENAFEHKKKKPGLNLIPPLIGLRTTRLRLLLHMHRIYVASIRLNFH